MVGVERAGGFLVHLGHAGSGIARQNLACAGIMGFACLLDLGREIDGAGQHHRIRTRHRGASIDVVDAFDAKRDAKSEAHRLAETAHIKHVVRGIVPRLGVALEFLEVDQLLGRVAAILAVQDALDRLEVAVAILDMIGFEAVVLGMIVGDLDPAIVANDRLDTAALLGESIDFAQQRVQIVGVRDDHQGDEFGLRAALERGLHQGLLQRARTDVEAGGQRFQRGHLARLRIVARRAGGDSALGAGFDFGILARNSGGTDGHGVFSCQNGISSSSISAVALRWRSRCRRAKRLRRCSLSCSRWGSAPIWRSSKSIRFCTVDRVGSGRM